MNDNHLLTGTVDYYHKTNHTHYDTWNSAGSAVIGTNQQTSQTRRWTASLNDLWHPDVAWVDTIDTKVFYQNTEAHDWTKGPSATGTSLVTTYSNYDSKSFGITSNMKKEWGIHDFRWGIDARRSDTERPFSQEPD